MVVTLQLLLEWNIASFRIDGLRRPFYRRTACSVGTCRFSVVVPLPELLSSEWGRPAHEMPCTMQ